jgi:hypothetical protein
MPDVILVDYYQRSYWPLLTSQLSAPGSAGRFGLAACGAWALLLCLGGRAAAGAGRLPRLAGVLALAQLALHVVYGEETLLYSLHFLPLLIIVAAAASRTRLRPAALGLAAAALVGAGVNNLGQFQATTALVDCLERREPAPGAETTPPWATAPVGLHRALEWCEAERSVDPPRAGEAP